MNSNKQTKLQNRNRLSKTSHFGITQQTLKLACLLCCKIYKTSLKLCSRLKEQKEILEEKKCINFKLETQWICLTTLDTA